MLEITKTDLQDAISKSKSMSEAAKVLGVSYDTFRKYAQKFGLFNPNPSGKGRQKPKKFKNKEDIFKIFDYNVGRFTVKNWYLLEREYKCERCGAVDWQGEQLTLELEHVNGDRKDNRLENLKLLCPNCHSQTTTWRKKKQKPV